MSRAPVIALARAKRTRTYTPGMCLRFVRDELFGIAAVYPDAATAWEHTQERRASWPPPAGMPVYWTGGSEDHGHIAISAGAGNIYTTDNPLEGRGEVGRCPIDTIAARWGLRYRGGALDVNNVVVFRWSEIDLSKIQHAAEVDPSASDDERGVYLVGTRLVESALYVLGYLEARYAFDGSFGSKTIEAYARWQREIGYSGGDADGIPGARSLARLGERYHWKVIA